MEIYHLSTLGNIRPLEKYSSIDERYWASGFDVLSKGGTLYSDHGCKRNFVSISLENNAVFAREWREIEKYRQTTIGDNVR